MWTNYKCCIIFRWPKTVYCTIPTLKCVQVLKMAILLLACVWTRISCVLLHLWRFPPAPFCGVYYIAYDGEPLSVPFSCVWSKSRMMADFVHSSYNLRFVWCLFSLHSFPLTQLVCNSLDAPLHNFVSFGRGVSVPASQIAQSYTFLLRHILNWNMNLKDICKESFVGKWTCDLHFLLQGGSWYLWRCDFL